MKKRLAKIVLLTAVGTSLLLIVPVIIYWAPDRSVAELKQWQLPNSEFITVQGMQAHVVRANKCASYHDSASKSNAVNTEQPKTIVLLHGTSASLHTWEGWTEALSADYCVVSMDLPGFGLTGPYADSSTRYTSANYASFVIEVLDKLNLDSVILAGNSLGGKIAWRTAALYPERIDKLILVDAVGYPATPKSIPLGFKLATYPALRPILGRILPRSVVKKSILSVYADDSKVDDALIDRYYDLSLRTGNRGALSARLNDFDNIEDREQIKQLALPTLIMWGAKDELIPVENAEFFHRDIANSQLQIFDNLGHVPHEEDSLATVAVVQQFLIDTK